MTKVLHRVSLNCQPLESRVTPAGNLTVGGEFNSLEFGPDGRLHEIFWEDHTLKLRTRDNGGAFSEQTVLSEDDPIQFIQTTGYYPRRPDQAQLVITPDGTLNVFKIKSDSIVGYDFNGNSGSVIPNFSGASIVEQYRLVDGAWSNVDSIAIPTTSQNGLFQLVAESGSDGQLHLAISAISPNLADGELFYATRTGGGWQVTKIADTGPLSQLFSNQGLALAQRSFDLAINAANHAHIAFTNGYFSSAIPSLQIGSVVRSDLAYATNESGNFRSAVIATVPDNSGDAALSMSIAVAPNGQVGIAAFYVDRAATGSPVSSQLVYHSRIGDLSFGAETVIATPDGYVGSDGPRFTGANPDLAYDANSVPLIVFSDHASRHAPFAIETAGQIRLAERGATGWGVQTLLRQSDTIGQQVLFPTLAVSNNELAITSLVDNSGVRSLGRINLPRGTGGSPPAPIANPGPLPFDAVNGFGVVAVGAGNGGSPLVVGIDAKGNIRPNFVPYEANFQGGVRTTMADVNNDGVNDLIVGSGPGRVASVQVFDGKTGTLIHSINAFDGFTGGVYVASADIDGDGFADLVISADQGGGSRIRVLSGRDESVIADFFGIEDPDFRGGARVAIADVDADGVPDILVGAGFGGGPRLAVFNGRLTRGSVGVKLFGDFFVFEQSLRNGVFLTGGDLDGDNFDEIVVGGGPGGGPRIFALSGRALAQSNGSSQVTVANFFGGDVNSRGGIRLTTADLDGDGRDDLIVGAGEGAGSLVTAYSGKDIPADGVPPTLWQVDPFGGFGGGVFVG